MRYSITAQWDDIRIPPNTIVEARDLWEVTYPTSRQHATWSLDDLPRIVACTMHQGSAVTSMDFHPSHHTLLLVGSATGEITLWEVGMRDKLVSKPFKIWDMENCSMPLQEAGYFSVVLKCVLAPVAVAATSALRIPTIGVRARTFCSDQVN